jgi:hypothetical protein
MPEARPLRRRAGVPADTGQPGPCGVKVTLGAFGPTAQFAA